MSACTKCGVSMNPVERMLGPICGACVRDAHASVTGGAKARRCAMCNSLIGRTHRTRETKRGLVHAACYEAKGLMSLREAKRATAPRVNVLKGAPGEGWAVAVAGDIVARKITSQIDAQQMARRECKRVGRDPDDYTIEGVPHEAWVAPSVAYGHGERGEKIRANVHRLRRWRLSPTGDHYLTQYGVHAYVRSLPLQNGALAWEVFDGDDFVARGSGSTVKHAKELALEVLDREVGSKAR